MWLLFLTASAVLPAQLPSCLPESPCLAACFTGRQGLFNEFCEQLVTRSRGGPGHGTLRWTRTSEQAGKALRSQGHHCARVM